MKNLKGDEKPPVRRNDARDLVEMSLDLAFHKLRSQGRQ
jgi:hypothetical protein